MRLRLMLPWLSASLLLLGPVGPPSAAGADDLSLLVAALDDREKQNQLVAHVARHHPQCTIIARALDRHHVYELEAAGAHHVERELFEASLSAGRRALIELGAHPFKAERQARAFREQLEASGVGMEVTLVDEHRSTEEARRRYFVDNPPSGWRRLMPRGLLTPPVPYDDYVAIILAERYLAG